MTNPLSRLARLRAGTRDAHARIETVPALARLLAEDLTQAEYVAVLAHMHGFLAALEPAVAAVLARPRPDAAALLDGGRLRALADDLDWFGAASQPLLDTLPALAGPDAALGALYVIEGSGLGGRVIARHLADSLGVAPGAGGSFYCGLSAAAARLRWQRFCALLDPAGDLLGPAPTGSAPPPSGLARKRPANDDPAHDDCCELRVGAIATFRSLERWLRRIDVVRDRRQLNIVAVTA